MPNKNLRNLGGIPLIGHSIRVALAMTEIDRVVCSTDSEEIRRVSKDFGAEAPFLRPSELASDSSPEFDAWKHLASYLISQGAETNQAIVSLPPTAPLRRVVDVQRAIDKLFSSDADLVVTFTKTSSNPWFNMVKRETDDTLRPVLGDWKTAPARRQDAPPVYSLVPVAYVTRIGYIQDSSSLFQGRVRGVEVPPETGIDIDTQRDLDVAASLYNFTNQ